MYCPRCATEFQDGSQEVFCRGCGMALATVTSLMTGEPSEGTSRRSPLNSSLIRTGMALFILGLVVALLNAAVAGLIGIPEVYGKTFFLLMVACGMGCIGLGILTPKRRRPKSSSSRGSLFKDVNTPATTNHLPPISAQEFAVPSVTEDTTRNLRSSRD